MIELLLKQLNIAPVMGQFHPLWSLCFPPDVVIAHSAKQVAEQLDGRERHEEKPILITEYNPAFADRFLSHHLPDCPPADLINRMLPLRMNARQPILTHKEIGKCIVSDTQRQGYETVILLLVDGLCYDDTRHWSHPVTPCLIAGPSITFAQTNQEAIVRDVGFPGIVGQLPIARQLAQVGLPRSRGYSYWEREKNDVSEFLFSGMPLQRVSGINTALTLLRDINLQGLYIQIVREGTDGLAHRRREVTAPEVEATVKAIWEDFQQLVELVAENGRRAAIYLVSDHGILWKYQHAFVRLPDENSAHARYTWERPFDPSCATLIPTGNGACYLYHYPFIGRQIPANDSGTHGGLSYWESIVPFVHVEVNV
ncbi:MAG: hypothetical protein IAE79_11610 [Anaerolinea sp.]|nr:hypothetical protein [Anaerolinea sp.]